MANYDNPNGFRPAKSLIGGSNTIEALKMQAASGATIAVGDAVIISSGYIAIALSNSSLIHGVAASSVSSATEGDEILVWPATPWNVFEGQCSGTYAVTMRGTAVDIEGTTGIMEIDENATTEKVAQIIGESGDPNNSVGANSRVLFTFVRSSFTGLEDAEA